MAYEFAIEPLPTIQLPLWCFTKFKYTARITRHLYCQSRLNIIYLFIFFEQTTGTVKLNR